MSGKSLRKGRRFPEAEIAARIIADFPSGYEPDIRTPTPLSLVARYNRRADTLKHDLVAQARDK
jgi:hypothetical protein